MGSNRQRRTDDLCELLDQLYDSWSTEASNTTEPPTLTKLFQSTRNTLALQARGELHNTLHQSDSGNALLTNLCNIARCALDPPTGAKARTRTLALDCLRFGVELGDGGNEGFFSDVLEESAIGARDERWGVRAAAARLAGAVLRAGAGRSGSDDRRLLSLLSSRNGCWLPALLADAYPEVEQCARIAVCGATTDTGHEHSIPYGASTDVAPSTSCLWSVDAFIATVRSAKEALLEATPSFTCGRVMVDMDVENTTHTALRALRGVCSLTSFLPPLSLGTGRTTTITAVFVEGLEAIEAFLASTLTGPLSAPPWTTGPNRTPSDAPWGSLSAEARHTVRALAGRVRERQEIKAAAVAAVDTFREECVSRTSGRSTEEGENAEKEDCEIWRRLYGGLLVRLEVFLSSADLSAASQPLTERVPTVTTIREDSVSGLTEHDDDRSALNNDEFGSFWIRNIAEVLEEVPFAYEQAVPSFHEDNKMPASERDKMIRLGEKRRRWMTSCTQLLLEAGVRSCGKRADSTAPKRLFEVGDEEAVIKLLLSVLPFEHRCMRADDPTEAWLLSVGSDRFGGQPPAPGSLPSSQHAAAAASTGPSLEIVTPIPWEICVRGRHLRRHELPAPWAADPHTRQLATDLIEACWQGLSLDSATAVAIRNVETLVQALRAKVRKSGWREGPGVGGKYAVAAIIRRLKYPLVTGATLGHLLPLVLPLADDFDSAHQAVGWSLILHVEGEATRAELAWHRGLLLEVLERGLRGVGWDASASTLCLAAAVALLRCTSNESEAVEQVVGRAGLRMAREALSQGGKTTDMKIRVVMVAGAAALLELPATAAGYAPCEILRPALLCLLPILQSSVTLARLDARAAALRTLHALCLSCWPRVRAHSAKLLCALLWTCGDCARRKIAASECLRSTDGMNSLKPSASLFSADEGVLEYGTRLGALILLLSGNSGRSTLREVCGTLSGLRSVGAAMEQLSDRAEALSKPLQMAAD